MMLRLTSCLTTLLLCLGVLLTTAHAQTPSGPQTRGNNRLVGTTIADQPSTLYRFEKHNLSSVDGKRHYRIEISIPLSKAPKAGYPVLYMLDGNAAMDTLTEQDLASVSRGNPPVLVAIGYDIPQRNDVVSRSYDYTPPVFEQGKAVAEPVVRGRVGGGAGIFLDFITNTIRPLVRSRANIDSNKAYLWGHSYGGLFTLYTLFSKPDAFTGYVVGDPSAWWYDGVLMTYWQGFDRNRAAGKQIAILVGTKARPSSRPAPATIQDQNHGQPIDTRAAVKDMADGLRQGGAAVSYETFPQYGHGDMIRASLERALKIAAQS